ncbi:RsmD family RNA methyltransferase [Methanococcus voltae]|uniref:RNA methyltransferase related protein n=1 Tax=Methanococcus voltae (strain ATCC BAA-1334 / A3) TaxID=456320 RepID=D7DTA3_METV3
MISRGEIIQKVKSYKPCKQCNKPISKTIPLKKLNLKGRQRKCHCGRSQIDDVMVDVANILIECNEVPNHINDDKFALKDVGMPMIEAGYPLKYAPVLCENDLVLLNNYVSKDCANEIIKIPEIKSVISHNKRIAGKNSKNMNDLIVGDDFRCDIFTIRSLSTCVISCKNQSKLHIEFPRPFNPKINKIEKLDLTDKVVLDGFCGCGTLGMVALKKGAKKVIFSDINDIALYDLEYNLKINFGNEIFENNRVEIIHSDFMDLDFSNQHNNSKNEDNRIDVCFVDLFPNMESKKFLEKAKKLSKYVILV